MISIPENFLLYNLNLQKSPGTIPKTFLIIYTP